MATTSEPKETSTMRIVEQFLLIAALALPAAALAHGGGQHLMGIVKSIDEKGLAIETTEKKEVHVVFDESTKFEKAGAPSSAKELANGQRVVVHTAKKQGISDPVAVLVKFAAKNPGDVHVTRAVALSVKELGFTPDHLRVKKGAPVDLVITRKTEKTCATTINIPDYGLRRDLPLNEAVTIRLTPKKTGEIKYSCGMGMLGGVLTVE